MTESSKSHETVFEFADSLGTREEEAKIVQELETWVTFRLDRTLFGVPVTRAQEVLRVTGLTRVPHAPFGVRGVTNMRGHVLPVVDLRLRLGLASIEIGPKHRIVVVGLRGRLVGLLVDAVEQVAQIDRLAIEDPPDEVVTTDSYYIVGVYQLAEDLLVLLDAEKILELESGKSAARGDGGGRPAGDATEPSPLGGAE